MDKNNYICQRPFTEIEIHTDGNVYTCCPDYLKNYPIGNIFEAKSFDEIWYSDKAKRLRQSVIENSFVHCNTSICNMKINEENTEYSENPPYPTLVRYSYDQQCNVKCMFCRDDLLINTEEKNKQYDEMIERIFIPILKNAKLMSITSAGEITASEHSKKLLKRAAEVYPNLKFELLTNGLLFNEDFYNSLALDNRIYRIVISIHAMKKKTYETIVRGSKYEIVWQNLEKIFQLKKDGKIQDVCLIFVTFSLNYKEIPEYIEFSLKNGVHPAVWEYRNHNKTLMDKNFNKYAVWQKTHPQYNDFVKVLKYVKEKYNNSCRMPELFDNLEPISIIESLKYRLFT